MSYTLSQRPRALAVCSVRNLLRSALFYGGGVGAFLPFPHSFGDPPDDDAAPGPGAYGEVGYAPEMVPDSPLTWQRSVPGSAVKVTR